MSLIRNHYMRSARLMGACLAWMAMAAVGLAQTISTTTVQGTVYLANGTPGSGTLQISWPAFTTAGSQTVAAGRLTANIGVDGFVSVNLAPNLGSSPAGLFYTAVYHMSDGTTSTEYWVVPAAAQAGIAQVRSQVMPAAQAAQAVSKAYVDQAIQSLAQGNLTSTGGQLTGPLYLTGDPTQTLQAADKHYVDTTFAQAMPLTGGAATGPLTATQLGAAYQVDQFAGADFGAKLQACLATINSTYGGTCDARNFTGNVGMAANLTIATANTTVMLPCATIATASQMIVTAGTRNVTLHGCALRGASAASGSQGGTVLLYSGAGTAIQVGDRGYAADTPGFHLDNVVINTTGSSAGSTQAFAAYRTQELDLESLYLLGNANQTGMTLDGTGNYTGGTFYDNHISGFQTAINGVGHQVTNSAATDWLNASTFVRLHIDCPTSNSNPISGTYGVSLLQADGNTFTGGDVENCATAVHLGANAQNNTIIGLRNENSTYQVVADAGSSYNSWMTGGTMFTGKLNDNGTRNSFLDTFHRSFNSLNGDWYGSQQDATLTNHYRLGIGNGNERGLFDRYQTDYGYRWTMGLSDATGGEQFYQVLDELNNVYRISVGQYNNGQASTNNQTVINAAGTGAVVLNGSNNAGTGGVVFGSGGASETTVATVSNAGNAQFNGTLQVGGTAQSAGTMTVRNNADAEVDYYLWPGIASSQKGSFTYKDYNGNSQWYLVKDASNNWAVNSAVGGLDSFKAYQSTNSGDTYVNASNASGVVRVNYEPGAGSAFNIYGGGSSNLYASFSGTNSIKFPGLSASSGHNCMQIDSSGYITNTGIACGSGAVNSGTAGQIAYYTGNGAAVSGMSSIPVTAGGTGATDAAGALAALGGASLTTALQQDFAGPVTAPTVNGSLNGVLLVTAKPYFAKCDGKADDQQAIQSAFNDALTKGVPVQFPTGTCLTSTITYKGQSFFGAGKSLTFIQGKPGQDVFEGLDVSTPTYAANSLIRDLTIVVDDSVNAASNVVGGSNSFPNRISGTSGGGGTAGAIVPLTNPPAIGPVKFGPTVTGGCLGVGITAGSTTLTCTSGDAEWRSLGATGAIIGMSITVQGAGVGGANLVTTVAAVPSNTSFTLATAASTTVSGGSGSLGPDIPNTTKTYGAAPWYFGNCGIALPGSSNTGNTSGPNNWRFSNVNFSRTGSTNPRDNHACAIFIQAASYALRFDHMQITGLYGGIIEALPNSYTGLFQWSPDSSSYNDIDFSFNTLPLVMYNGGNRVFSNVNIYGGEQMFAYGPFLFNPNGQSNNTAIVNGLFFECFTPNSGENSRWSGWVTMGMGAGLDECGGQGGSYTAWYANQGSTELPIGSINIYGNGNTFKHTGFGAVVNDYGQDNSFEEASTLGQSRRWYTNRPREPLNKLNGGFIETGNSTTPYASSDDLMITCGEFNFAFNTGSGGGTAPGCTNDPTGTEITKSYVHLTSTSHPTGWQMTASGTSQGQGPIGKYLVIGDRLPQVKTKLVVIGRCNVACTHTIQVSDDTSHVFITSQPVTFGTNWTVQSFTADLSTTSVGDLIGIQTPAAGLWTGGVTSVDIALYAFEPVNTDALANVTATVTSSINSTLAAPPAIGSTTPNAGYFTTLNALNAVSLNGNTTLSSSTGTINFDCISTFASGSCLTSHRAPSGQFAADQIYLGGTRYWIYGGLSGGGNDFIFQSSQHANHNVLRLNAATDAVTTFNNTLDDGSGNVSIAGRTAINGYLSTGTTSNTDVTGRLTLSNATTASYTFTKGPSGGSYNQVNCVWQPRFNTGAVQWWDTSTGSAASIATSSPVSGTFAYVCVVQN